MTLDENFGLGPAGSRRRLRQGLRRAREMAGLTQEQAARELVWHLSKVLRIEAGTSGVSVTDLHAMLRLYGADDRETVEAMTVWARTAKEKRWWSAYKSSIPRGYEHYLALESEAVAVCFFQECLVPGLLQTEAYARGVLWSVWQQYEQAANQRVALRLRRQQEAFGRARPLKVTAVLDEAVLHRMVGTRKVMKGQLEHLLDVAGRPYLDLRVLPFTVTERPFFGDNFTILEVGGFDDAVVYVEASTYGRTDVPMDRRQEIDAYRGVFRRFAEVALSADESTRMIQAIADGL
ncbi:MAG TPA: helix-turn-helix transcriptional regulator [Pilimelia sp.]|nr:helix-turn-helix transcriptional regulator [Pilimelia sp.]